ncbi:MAG TPA: peptidoglycan-binding protein [Candidatus Stackebrandtia excrementipullorum]|nr:peptidoglycan-binding protein [Candidatus Stackebrandtia excrementipullorum]
MTAEKVPSLRSATVAKRRARNSRITYMLPRRRLFQAATAASFAAMGVFPVARAAYADGYDIYTGPCPSYAENHDCSPGCGPSTIFGDACETSGDYLGFHRDDGVDWILRPNQCYSGTYDGWLWKYENACGSCACSVERRCHDGYRNTGSGWVRSICRWNTDCGCASTVTWPRIASGAFGDDVATIQYLLVFRNHELDVDSDFGPLTKAAVQEFQRGENLPVTGVVDAATWAMLVETIRRSDDNDAVRAVQVQLNKHGHKLVVDGVVGPLTVAAVTDFQRQSNLTVDGIVGQNTWRTLTGGVT